MEDENAYLLIELSCTRRELEDAKAELRFLNRLLHQFVQSKELRALLETQEKKR